MFDDYRPKARPAFLAAVAMFERRDALRCERPGSALDEDDRPNRPVCEPEDDSESTDRVVSQFENSPA